MIIALIGGYKRPFLKLLNGVFRGQTPEDVIKTLFPNPDVDLLYKTCAMLDYKQDEYEHKWDRIYNQYKRIVLYKIEIFAIGELLAHYFGLQREKEDDTLKVMLPVVKKGNEKICNREIIRYIGMPDSTEVKFWLWAIENHHDQLVLSEMDRYLGTRFDYSYVQKANSVRHSFSSLQEKKGEFFFREQSIETEKYICFSNRSSYYGLSTYKGKDGIQQEENVSFRNFGFGVYEDTIKKFFEMGIRSVKMGRDRPGVDIENMETVVDYAGMYADDFLDLFLYANCKFAISAQNGIYTMANLFAKPLLVVNTTCFSYGAGGLVFTDLDLFLPVKYYSKKKRRFLCFREIFELERERDYSNDFFLKHNIDLIYNTKEEILEAALEINERIDGTWNDTEEDIAYYNMWEELISWAEKEQEKSPNPEHGGPSRIKPAASFLRRNSYFMADYLKQEE